MMTTVTNCALQELRKKMRDDIDRFFEEIERALDVVWEEDPGSKTAKVGLIVDIDPTKKEAHSKTVQNVKVRSVVSETRETPRRRIEFGPEDALFGESPEE